MLASTFTSQDSISAEVLRGLGGGAFVSTHTFPSNFTSEDECWAKKNEEKEMIPANMNVLTMDHRKTKPAIYVTR